MTSTRRPLSHRHALRAALAVTGRARRPLLLCCALMVPMAACLPDDTQTDVSWSLSDSTPERDADMRASDLSAPDLAVPDMAASGLSAADMYEPDPGVPDASPDQDASMAAADMPPDMQAPDLTDVEDCVDAEGQTDWVCCERTALAGNGCELCSNVFGSEEPVACLSCYLAQDQWFECCERLEPLLDDEIAGFDPLGCTPWGPPAPPSYSGATLQQILAV